MNTGSRITVFRGDKFACIRVIGRANFRSSIDFKTLVNELSRRGCAFFVIELSECILMDSTFLGVLAGFGLRLRGPEDPGAPKIELLNPNARITELLENLGVLHLFRVAHGNGPGVPSEAEREQPATPASKEDLSRTCLEAHQTLMDLNPENAARFKDVARFLAEEIRNS